jgi:hypothetical protein
LVKKTGTSLMEPNEPWALPAWKRCSKPRLEGLEGKDFTLPLWRVGVYRSVIFSWNQAGNWLAVSFPPQKLDKLEWWSNKTHQNHTVLGSFGSRWPTAATTTKMLGGLITLW